MTATQGATMEGLTEEDALRADLYDLLALLLARPPSAQTLIACSQLTGGADDFGRAAGALAKLARQTDEKAASREYHALFIGLGRGEVLPYASYYMTGFLHEKPLATLRGDMAGLGIERAPGVSEPEDHIASLCDMMAGMIRGRYAAPTPLPRQRDFFNRHMAVWAAHVFSDIETADGAALYAPVGALGRAFMEVEKAAFRFAA
jgi:TorA maturation chaperone TorD